MDFRVAQALVLMRLQFRTNHYVKELARSANLSTCHFCRLFKKETGFTPAQYLKQIRMRRAAELLETSCMSVKEVSAAVGLKSSSHFDRFFKNAHCLTPLQYRNRHLGKPAERPTLSCLVTK